MPARPAVVAAINRCKAVPDRGFADSAGEIKTTRRPCPGLGSRVFANDRPRPYCGKDHPGCQHRLPEGTVDAQQLPGPRRRREVHCSETASGRRQRLCVTGHRDAYQVSMSMSYASVDIRLLCGTRHSPVLLLKRWQIVRFVSPRCMVACLRDSRYPGMKKVSHALSGCMVH